MLKLQMGVGQFYKPDPAAFRRLCVETQTPAKVEVKKKPAAFRRLCVETTLYSQPDEDAAQPPLGGCVLKQQ